MKYQTKYHSTGQMRNAVKHLINKFQFKGVDVDGNPIFDKTTKLGTVDYVGSIKLHGTNASVVLHEDGAMTFHSKEQYLASIDPNGNFELGHDNAEFAQSMSRRYIDLSEIMGGIVDILKEDCRLEFPIKISGEWVGSGIQKGVGISFLNKKSFFVFGVKVGEEWRSALDFISAFPDAASPGETFFNIHSFPKYSVEIDLNFPQKSASLITAMVDEVEAECPVAKKLGVESDCMIGEGLVWTPVDEELFADTGTWFKTKGQKHSVSKVKKHVAISPEKIESIEKFVEYAVTENRLDQGLQEVGLDQKKVGVFIGWLSRDINKEEGDVLEANNLTMKDVGKMISAKARDYYLGKLNEM